MSQFHDNDRFIDRKLPARVDSTTAGAGKSDLPMILGSAKPRILRETESIEPHDSVWHGVCKAVQGSLVATSITTCLLAVHFISQVGKMRFDFEYRRLFALVPEYAWPIVGCFILGFCAGWASGYPRGHHRFFRSFATIVLLTVPLWGVIFSLELTPPRNKAIDHPIFYFSEFLVLALPPLLITALVTWYRVSKSVSRVNQSLEGGIECGETNEPSARPDQ